MIHGPKFLCAVLALVVHGEAASQQTFKCKDASERITYAGKPCEEFGLISAGEVRDRITINSGVTPPVAPAADRRVPAPPPATPSAAAPNASPAGTADGAAAVPERRCFTVKTAKGPVTRCNDVPPAE